jgi:hypothetical protein
VIDGDAAVNVLAHYRQCGILHPARLGILNSDRDVSRKGGERPAQLLDVHRSPSTMSGA